MRWSRGADPTVADNEGFTPLARAEQNGHKPVADILRQHIGRLQ